MEMEKYFDEGPVNLAADKEKLVVIPQGKS